MAEAIAAIGALSAIFTLVESFTKVAKTLHKCASHLKHARAAIKALSDETGVISHLLLMFYDSLERLSVIESSALWTRIETSRIGHKIAGAGDDCLNRLRDMLRKVVVMRGDRKTRRLQYFLACWRWNDDNEAIQPIYLIMNSVKLSANMLMNIILMDSLTTRRLALPDKSMPASVEIMKRISQLEADNILLQEQCRTLRDQCLRLQPVSNKPGLEAVTYEIVEASRLVVRKHIEDHPTILSVPKADRQDFYVPVGPADSSATKSTSGSSHTNGTTPPHSVDNLDHTPSHIATVASTTPSSTQIESKSIVGPSSGYRHAYVPIESLAIKGVDKRRLRQRLAYGDLAGRYNYLPEEDLVRRSLLIEQGVEEDPTDGFVQLP